MTLLGTMLFFAFAVGLMAEAALAWRHCRRLNRRQVIQVFGVGSLGLLTVLRESLSADHDVARQISGWAVAGAWIACLVVDGANRVRAAGHSGQSSAV